MRKEQIDDIPKRDVEPLAFKIEGSPIHPQTYSPLFASLPGEIRNMIYEYVFTKPTKYNEALEIDRHSGDLVIPKFGFSLALLQTCKAIYLEAYKLPLLLNPFCVYVMPESTHPRWSELAPWQFALIQGLELTLGAVEFENSELVDYLERWQYELRHRGALVLPGFFPMKDIDRPPSRIPNTVYPESFAEHSFQYGVWGCENPIDGDYLEVAQPDFSEEGGQIPHTIHLRRAMAARPIRHLTIRTTQTLWWDWCPVSHGPEEYFCWVALAIEKMPDLRKLEFVLESFSSQVDQLIYVVKYATYCTFPLEVTGDELIWDGKEIEEANWGEGEEVSDKKFIAELFRRCSDESHFPSWIDQYTGIVPVRIIRFKRVRASSAPGKGNPK